MPGPLALIAEVTHRCPLHCVYCSNPLQMMAAKTELPTEDWVRVFQQAAKLGVLHLHLTGGEPLARQDLTQLIAAAHKAGLYTNLITSGLGMTEARLQELIAAGLDHIQLSFQDSRADSADWIAGTKAHARKVDLSKIIHRQNSRQKDTRQQRIAFTVNLVVHRQNLDHLDETIRFIETLQPDRMEIAHVQYYGWALENRAALMPTREQVDKALLIVAEAQKRTAGKIRIDSVVPDYYARYPKACMGGWGRQLLLVDPAGRVLPCHAAGVIPGLTFDNVKDHALEWIWKDSPAFQKFRGEDWMPEPCRSCDRRKEDFGGCRCQAMLLLGNAAATDPACHLSPDHHVMEEALRTTQIQPAISQPAIANSFRGFEQATHGLWAYRVNPSAK
jgi:pyrroloquinoline quinone biosynthesis protein E